MYKEDKDKSLRIAAAAVTATLILGLGGALVVHTALGLIILVAFEAAILIGTGLLLRHLSSDKGH
jgi:hypothetical protein